MSRSTQHRRTSRPDEGEATSRPGRARRRLVMLIVAIVLAILVGAIGGAALYSLLALF